MKTFAQQLCEARSKKGLTQEALAEALHVSRSTISHWEHARALPDVETVKRIAQVLGEDFWADDGLQQKQSESVLSTQQNDAISDNGQILPPPAKNLSFWIVDWRFHWHTLNYSCISSLEHKISLGRL